MTNISHFSLKNVITWLKTSLHCWPTLWLTLRGKQKSRSPNTCFSPFFPPKRNSYQRKRTQSYEAVGSARRLLQYCQLPAIATGWKLRGSNPGRGEIFCTCPDQPWGPPSLLYSEYWVFLGGKAAGAWRLPPTTSSAEVKERVELLSLWAFAACSRVNFTSTFTFTASCRTKIGEIPREILGIFRGM